MKKISLFVLILLLIASISFFVIRNSPCKIDTSLSLGLQAVQVFEQNSCLSCHSPSVDIKKPFYANFPIVKNLVEKDIYTGNRFFNLLEVVNLIKENKYISQTCLTKIEASMDSRDMPPLQYSSVHWASNLNKQETDIVLAWLYAQRQKQDNAQNYTKADEFKNEPVSPINAIEYDRQKAYLGEILYHDVRLSGDNTISCASCHPLDNFGVDSLQYSTGIKGQKGDINAPSVFNAVYHIKQFWDSRAGSLQEQAGGPPLNPVEMGSASWEEICQKLNADKSLKEQFLKVYPDGFNGENITNAIAEFEKTLVTVDSPFDLYLKGDKNAISQNQKEGYDLFKKARCISCHNGPVFGGNSLDIMGLRKDYFKDRKNVSTPDFGVFNVTKNELDKNRFKTPSLTNISKTAPYFHDGTVLTLKEAVEKMLKYQSKEKLSAKDIDKIVDFLHALNGKYTPAKLSDN